MTEKKYNAPHQTDTYNSMLAFIAQQNIWLTHADIERQLSVLLEQRQMYAESDVVKLARKYTFACFSTWRSLEILNPAQYESGRYLEHEKIALLLSSLDHSRIPARNIGEVGFPLIQAALRALTDPASKR